LLRQFIDSAHDIISMKDRNGRYIVYNPASAALFSRDPLEFIGRTAEEIYDPDIAGTITRHDREVMEKGEYRTFTEHYLINGKEYYLMTVRFPIFDYDGHVEGVATIARNITQERQLQQQLLQSAKLAAVGKLAAGVAHEINNPLTGVLAYAEDLLEEAAPDDERRTDYEVIVRETLRCRDIVRNLLDFARQDDPHIQTIDLNDVIDKSLVLIERLPRFQDIEIQRRPAPEPLLVAADSRQLQQVVLNLIINANDAMNQKGTITITSGSSDDGRHHFLSVMDTGPGVPETLRDRIFEPFFSTKATSGLGLAVSWGIVERHGGRIEVGDNPNEGAEFRILLPRDPGSP
jgi:two-component system NtrC family sensor kinase